MERPCDTAEMRCAPRSHRPSLPEQAPFDPLARMLAHEVRNILTPMRAKAQMAMDHPDDHSMTQRALEWSIKASRRISALSDTILLGSSEEADRVLICDVLDELQDELPLRKGQKPRVYVENQDDLAVNTSPTALRHILLNLLLNAERASAANNGSVNVACERSTWNTAGVHKSGVLISIEDDGRGLDESTLNRLNMTPQSHPMSTANRSEVASNTGSPHVSPSVGLFVVEKLLSMVNGEIQAFNMPVGGARITIKIPDLERSSDSIQSQAA